MNKHKSGYGFPQEVLFDVERKMQLKIIM